MSWKYILDDWNNLVEKSKKNLSKLVPVKKEITRQGKRYMTTVYVKPDEVKNKAKTKKVDVQKQLRPIRKNLGTERYKEYLKANGISWEPNKENVGADTMRASMAAKKWIEKGNELDKGLYEFMLKGGNPNDYKKSSGEQKISNELQELIKQSDDSLDMLSEAQGNTKLFKELKELMSQEKGSVQEKLDNIFSKFNGGSEASTYLEPIKKDPLDFEIGNEVFKDEKYKLVAMEKGSRDDNGGGRAIAKTIFISSNVIELKDETTAINVLTHEFAHTITNRFPELEKHIASNPNGIFGRVNKKSKRFEPALHESFRIGAVGSRATPEEVWADSYSAYLANPDGLKEKNPEIYEFVDKVYNKVPRQYEELGNLINEFLELRKPNLDRVNSHDDLAEFARDKNVQLKLSRLKLSTSKEVLETILKSKEKVPFLNNTRMRIESISPSVPGTHMRKNYYAYVLGPRMVLNEDRYQNPNSQLKESYEKDIKVKWHPEGTDYKSIVTHEIGHILHNEMADKLDTDVAKLTSRIKRNVLKNLKIKPADVTDGLSAYATVNTKEFFAEAFAEWIDSENPRPIAKEFGRILQEELKKIDAR